MTPVGFFEASLDSRSSYTFNHIQFDTHKSSYITPLLLVFLADLDAVRQYKGVRKFGFDPVPTIFALQRSSEIDWEIYVGVEHTFLGYNFYT